MVPPAGRLEADHARVTLDGYERPVNARISCPPHGRPPPDRRPAVGVSRRQRGGGPGRLRAERSHRASTRSRRLRRWASTPTTGPPRGGRTCGARSRDVVEMQSEAGAAGALHGALQKGALGDDVHRVAGPAADDPQHVQDRRRADAGGHPRRGPHRRHARAVDLRRPQRRDGGPRDRLGHAGVRLGAGGARLRPGRARGDAARRGCRSCISSTASAPRTRSPRSTLLDDDDLRAPWSTMRTLLASSAAAA